ncbi:hypothetical protein [Rhizomicrobium electricum]|uniref:Uncharacterized protein n=1 Tax=Rhizomicrobium electricum TaxID=480070 RepID=A0ABN1E4E3_9PROT|nr:hypothetical protein [Rhizomicrobium electricum]NIJ47621.1 hypothetical protein [Rhizomicrobium electricum]
MLRVMVIVISAAAVAVGIYLVSLSLPMPEWTDEVRADAVKSWLPPEDLRGATYDAYNRKWTAAMDAARTNKWPLYDAGTSLIATGVSLVLGTLLLGIRRGSDLGSLQTPKSRWFIVLLCTLAWFGLWLTQWELVFQDFNRWRYPTWADTIAIPLASFTIYALVGWPVLALAGWFGALRKSVLPINLWVWRTDAPFRSYAFTALAWFALALVPLLLQGAFTGGPYWAVPEAFLWFYCVAITRAAALSFPLSMRESAETTP